MRWLLWNLPEGYKVSDYLLASEQAREAALNAVRAAPDGYMVSIHPAKRTVAANRFYWAMLRDVSDQIRPEGRQYDADTFHEWFKTKLLTPKIIELPSGKTKQLEPSTTELDKAEFSAYVEQVMEWAVSRGVKFSADTRDEFLMFEASKRRK